MKSPQLFLFLVVFALLSATGLSAGDFTVTNNNDSGPGSLRDALASAAATVGQDDTITFQNTLSGATIDISGGGPLVLSAAGRILVSAQGLAQPVTITAFGLCRIFEVGAGVELELNDLVLAEGSADWGQQGNDGEAPTSGGAGESGGGIRNEGSLILRRCKMQFCLAGNGGRGGHKSGAPLVDSGNGGLGGSGGAIYSTGAGASVRLEDCELLNNEAGAGGLAGDVLAGANGAPGQAGGGGAGGAIACDGGSLELVRTRIELNFAGSGGEGGADVNGGLSGPGGAGGDGGGVWILSGTLRVVDSTFENNRAGLGGPGGDDATAADTRGPGGKGGDGGGLWFVGFGSSTLPHVERSLFLSNKAGNGWVGGDSPGIGNGESGTAGGDGGRGGGLYLAGGAGAVWRMVNSTVILNFAGDGGRGGNGTTGGTAGASGAGGDGGGFAFVDAGSDYTATLTHLTVISNNAGFPGGAGSPGGVAGAGSTGGGISEVAGGINSGDGITLANSVVALNDAGTIDNICPFLGVGENLTAGDPEVEALADNGGPTLTVAPRLGSPILDGGGALVDAPSVDQRGEPRPINGVADLGAFEGKFQPDARIGASSNPATHRIDNFYTASGAGQVLPVKLKGTKPRAFHVSVQNDGEIDDHLFVTGTKAAGSIRFTALRITGTVENVTAALIAGYRFDEVEPGAVNVIQGTVKARSKKVRARQTLAFSLRSDNAAAPDTVLAGISSAKVKRKKK